MSDQVPGGDNTATAPVADAPQVPEGLTTDKRPSTLATPAATAPAADVPKAEDKPGEPGKSIAAGGDPTKDDKPADPKVEDKKPEAPEYTPIAAADLKLPENLSKEDPILKAALEGATEAKLGKDALQPLIDKVAPQLKELQEAPLREWAAKQKEWVNQIKTDPEIGGAALDKTVLPGIAKLLDASGVGKEAREALDFTGAGNHPAVVKLLHYAAKRLGEGTPVRGNPAPTARDPASLLYPTHSRANGAA